MHLEIAAAALFLALAPVAARGTEAFAVLPVAEPPGPDAGLVALADEVRAAFEARGEAGLTPESVRARMTGSVPASTLARADAAYQAAVQIHAGGDFEGSIRALRAAIAELEVLPGGAEVHQRWTRAMLRLARSEQAVGRRSEAQAVLERLLRVDPQVEVDPRLFPPGFQRLVEEVRADIHALWTRKLAVEADPGVQVLVEGRPVAIAPAVIELAPGRYRVCGGLGAVRSREVLVDLTSEDRSVSLDLSLAPLLQPDRGPGLAVTGAERAGRLLALARLLDVDRLVSVRRDGDGERRWLVASLDDARRGTAPVEGRVRLADGALAPGAAAALAAFLLTGEPSPLVEVPPAAKLGPVLPGGDRPRPGIFAWDGVKRPGARAYGWWATGGGAAAVALGVVSAIQLSQAGKAYADARAMRSGGALTFGHTVAEYNAAIRRGDRARQVGAGAAIGAGALTVGSIALGIVSYHRTGEIGPIRF